MTWLMFGKNLWLWLRQTDVDSLDINCGKAGGYHNFFPENVLLCCNKVSLPRLGLSEIQVIIHATAKCQEPVNGAKCLNGRTMLSFSDEDSLQKAFIKTLTLRGWEKTAQSPFTVRPVYFQCKMVYTQHVKRFELLTFTVWLCIKEEPFKKSESEDVLMSSWSRAHPLFTPRRFTDPSFKASKTNTRVSYTLRGGGNEAPLSSTASASPSLSVRVNIVARRGRGGSGRGDVWSRQTEAAWVKQTETKPAVRGSDSGGGEGGKTSEQHCVGDGNCGFAGHCLCRTWL